jgi:hypothetical protein
VQVTDVLEVALGVRVVGAEPPWLQQLALNHVDRLTEEMRRRTLPTVVDRRLLTELLDACGASRCGPARRRSCSPPGCASRPAGATTCGGWCRRRCPRSTATRGGCSPGPSPSPRRVCAMRSLGWRSPAAPESCIFRPQNLADTAALGGKGLGRSRGRRRKPAPPPSTAMARISRSSASIPSARRGIGWCAAT